MTPEQREAQRRSFAFGNASIENPRVTRELVDRVADEMARAPGRLCILAAPRVRQLQSVGWPAEDTMTIDHDRFAEANQPPPERVTETPEVEASPEEGKPPLDAVANVEGVAVACRLEEGTMQVTVLLPGRIESISTSVRVPGAQ